MQRVHVSMAYFPMQRQPQKKGRFILWEQTLAQPPGLYTTDGLLKSLGNFRIQKDRCIVSITATTTTTKTVRVLHKLMELLKPEVRPVDSISCLAVELPRRPWQVVQPLTSTGCIELIKFTRSARCIESSVMYGELYFIDQIAKPNPVQKMMIVCVENLVELNG